MPASFASRKEKIVATLSTPEDEYSDLSPKGSVDAGIRELIAEINALPDYVTTSSCAGRVAVYLEGGGKGAKGGGKWLFMSHESVDLNEDVKSASKGGDGELFQRLGLGSEALPIPADLDVQQTRFVHLKFEPMILHILCSSLPAAQHAASAALQAGFRESGVNGILDAKDQAHTPASPMVGVRSAGLAFDCVIGYEDGDSSAEPESGVPRSIIPMVTEQYLRILIGIANQRFLMNTERTERFRQALLRKQ